MFLAFKNGFNIYKPQVIMAPIRYLILYASLGNLTTNITVLLTIAVGPNRHDYSIDWSDDKS